MWWFEGVWWRKRRSLGEDSGAGYAVIIPAGVVAQSAGRRYAYSRRCAVVVPAGAVVQAPANVRIVRQRFLACNFIS